MSRELTGPPREVGAQVDALFAAGLFVTMGAPKRVGVGDDISVVVVVRRPVALQDQARALPAAPRSAWSSWRQLLRQRRVGRAAAIWGGAGAVLAGVVWLIARAVSAAGSWVGGNPTVAILGGFGLTAGAVAWLLRDRGGKTGGGGGCPGLTHHCNGCRDHR